MNANSFTLGLILVLCAVGAQAKDTSTQQSLSAVQVQEQTRLTVECANESVPTLRAVGLVLDTNNATQLYAERERLIHTAHRECMRGVARVVFVRDDAVSTPVLAVADTATTG